MMILPLEALQSWLRERTIGHRNDAVCAYHFLARRAARKFAGRAAGSSELEQVASIGLMKALKGYDPGYGAPFEVYAWRYVCGEVLHYLRDSVALLRLPRARKRDAAMPVVYELAQAEESINAASCARAEQPALEDRILLRMALEQLPRRERYIVSKLVAGHTQSEVASQLGFSQRHVSRLYAQAVKRMAHHWA